MPSRSKKKLLPPRIFGLPGAGKSLAISIVTALVLFSAWWIAAAAAWVSPLYLPSPNAVFARFLEVAGPDGFGGATLWQHTLASLYRVFGAFFLSCVTAIPVGLAMGMNHIARGVGDPPIEFYRPIPPLAYLPLTIIWFGIGETSKIILIFLACFAPMALSTRAGVRSVAPEQIHAAYSLGGSRWQVLYHVIFKAALPEILTGMRIALGFGWTTLVAAEMVAAEAGLGFMILNASEFLVTDVVMMGIIVIGAIAFATDLMMRGLEKLLVPWKGRI